MDWICNMRLVLSDPDFIGQHRRYLEERIDQIVTLAKWKLATPMSCDPFDGEPRFALLTVNRNTTRYLKLLLLTLVEQDELNLLHRIVICDNRSTDGAHRFLEQLTRSTSLVWTLRNYHLLSHARGMRFCISHLGRGERFLPSHRRSNILLFCDTDVVFRNSGTLRELARIFRTDDVALAGELRRHLYPYPEAQASFIALRADWYHRKDVVPWCNHGAPAYWMQRSIWKASGKIVNFPSNQGGYTLHRGRSAVEAARRHGDGSYATMPNYQPHFMGVPNGQSIWEEIEGRYSHWLLNDREPMLVDYLAETLASAGPR
jgi:hypothetical protein